MVPPGQPPAMPPSYGAPMAAVASNLASPGLRIVGGLIDVILLGIVVGIVNRIVNDTHGYISGAVGIVIYIGYFAYFLSQRGQTIGMMAFGFRVRDKATGQYPDVAKSALRGFIWYLEVLLTFCIIGAIGWLWQLWDPQKQAIHDKVAGTIVTTS